MAVDRKLLAQALGQSTPQGINAQNLKTGQSISDFVMDSSNFGSGQARGIGLAAQLPTAGVGAYTQYKAQKDINEQELASQSQFSKQFPHLSDIASTLSPETRQAYTLESLKNTLKANDPAAQLDLQAKELGLKKTQAEIDKLNKGEAPKYNIEKTDQGLFRINAQTGEAIPIEADGKPIGVPADKGKKPLSGESAKLLTISTGGIKSLNDLNKLLGEGGTVSKMSEYGVEAFKSPNDKQVTLLRRDLADSIGRLRSGGAIQKDEEKTFLSFVPNSFDDKETVQFKMGKLNEKFATIQAGLTGEDIQSQTFKSKDTTDKSGIKFLGFE